MRAAIVLAAIGMLTASARADPPPRNYDGWVQYLEPSYFLLNPLEKHDRRGRAASLFFEAQIAPHLPLFQRDVGYDEAANLFTSRGRQVLSLYLTPMIRARMTGHDSAPVLPPSFMPAFDLQLLRRWARFDGAVVGSVRQMAVQVRLGHHSNGQDGPFWKSEDGANRVNEDDGSFSTNYARLTASIEDIEVDENWLPERTLALSLYFELHGDTDPIPGGLDGDLGPFHGRMRAGVHALARGWPWRRTTVRVAGEAGDMSDPYLPFSGRIELDYFHWKDSPLGVALSAYYGSDYYNIRFTNHDSLLRIGVIWEHDRAPRLLRRYSN